MNVDERVAQYAMASRSRSQGESGGVGRWAKRVATALFHLFRYFVAACVAELALATLPLIAIVIVTGLFALLVIFSWLAFFLGAPLDGGAMQGVFWFIIAPLALMLFFVVGIITIIFVVAVYILVGVLPFALLVELVFWRISQRLSLRGVIARLMGFVVAGVVLGMLLGTVGLLLLQPEGLQGIVSIYLGAGLVSVFAEIVYGVVLTAMALTQKGIQHLLRRSIRKRETA